MAIALVQKTTQQFYDGVTTASRTLTGVTAGNLVTATVACVSQPNTSPTPALPTPSGWSVAIAPTGSTGIDAYRGQCAIYYKENASSGSHTIDFSGAAALPTDSYAEITIEEWSGAVTSGALDVVASSALATPNTSGTSGTTSSTTQADGLAIAVGCPGGGSVSALSTPPSSGFTVIDTEPTNSVHTAYDAGYKILAASGTQSASWTWTGDNAWVGVIATFKAASAAVAPLPGNITELPPIGRNYDYELRAFQSDPVGPANEISHSIECNYELSPFGRDFNFELSGFQAASINSDNNFSTNSFVFDLPPIGRDFNYELRAFQLESGKEDAYSGIALPTHDEGFPLGRDFNYELAGYQQGIVAPTAGTDNIIPKQTENPLFLGNYSVIDDFLFTAVGPNAPLLPSDPQQHYDLAPVLAVDHTEIFLFPGVGADAAPEIDANADAFYENPPFFKPHYPNIEGFQYAAVGPNAAAIPLSDPQQHYEVPSLVGQPYPGYEFSLSAVREDAPLTEEVVISHYLLPPTGRNYDFELEGFQASPLAPENLPASTLTVFDLAPEGRDFNYQLAGYQSSPLATDIPLMAAFEFPLYHHPEFDEDDITPFLGMQNSPRPSDFVPPPVDSGPSFYQPTFRPRRR